MSLTNEETLSPEQLNALKLLQSGENVFLTGGAGSGKSFLIRHFFKQSDPKKMPLLASTGAAAVLVGGRTFHSFFGLGIMEGGAEKAFDRGSRDGKLIKRLREVEGIIIDEISMIPASAFETAERLARWAKNNDHPWGGLRVIAVGDFMQLPPVAKYGQKREWCFQSDIWQKSGFQVCQLTHNQRVHDDQFLDILADIRYGQVTQKVRNFLESRLREDDDDDSATRLFPRRDQAEFFNQKELAKIPKQAEEIYTIYFGEEKKVEILKKTAPVPETLILKPTCRVMFLQNDPNKRWVNGTRGTVEEILSDKIIVTKDNGRTVQVDKTQFAMQDADGEVVASAMNFPLTLAYATTIHKAQGATLEELWVDLTKLWEPGHAYVALSRLQDGKGLKLLGWSKNSFIVDPQVVDFYAGN